MLIFVGNNGDTRVTQVMGGKFAVSRPVIG